VAVEAGKSYWWCSCGQSKNQPFCDGSHKGSEFAPVKWDATESKTVYFCGCKQSGKAPLCDGAHKSL
jgi:CDGSH-type Zn-finger protein